MLLSAHKQAHAALKMRAKACFGCAFCLACTRFCTKIRYKKDHEQALKARIKPHHAQGCLKIVQAALGAYLGAENSIKKMLYQSKKAALKKRQHNQLVL